MPRNSRQMMLGAAKVIRAEGESVTLLTSTATPDTSDATPYSASTYQQEPLTDTYSTLVIYARVTYIPSETITYDEGGRETNRRIKVEAPINLQPQMHKAFAVQIQDGTILRKMGEQISEGRDMFVIECQGELRVAQ